jgi:hypothetical protein
VIAELRGFQGPRRTVYSGQASAFLRREQCPVTMPGNKGGRPVSDGVPDRADDFAKAFYGLKMVFAKYEKHLHVTADTREKYYLETRSPSYKDKPLFFGAVIRGRAYVSFHLMPLYWEPSLTKGISATLKGRMQGKSCFNFSAPDAALFRELARLTSRGFALYKRKNLL